MSPINNELLKRLESIYQRKHDSTKATTPVIRDIIATHSQRKGNNTSYPFGEFTFANSHHGSNESNTETISRMLAYINDLASCAEAQHVQDNFLNANMYLSARYRRRRAVKNLLAVSPEHSSNEMIHAEMKRIQAEQTPQPILDARKNNHITRLTLNEFSFYPHHLHGPLSIESFNELVRKISISASEYPENIHLVLASIPVATEKIQVKNMVIYVECGETPRLHTFAKAIPHHDDPTYSCTYNSAFANEVTHTKISHYTVKNISVTSPAITIIHGGNIISRTAGGIEFRTGIDICRDHVHAVSKTLVTNDVVAAKSLSPTYATHIITSNSVHFAPTNIICDTVTQADSEHAHVYHRNHHSYVTRKIRSLDKFHLRQPIFGVTTTLRVYPLRAMDKHEQTLCDEIENNNKFLIRLSALKQYREQRPTALEEVYVEIEKMIFQKFYDDLYYSFNNDYTMAIFRNIINYHLVNIQASLLQNTFDSIKTLTCIDNLIAHVTANNDCDLTVVSNFFDLASDMMMLRKSEAEQHEKYKLENAGSKLNHSITKHHFLTADAQKHSTDQTVNPTTLSVPDETLAHRHLAN